MKSALCLIPIGFVVVSFAAGADPSPAIIPLPQRVEMAGGDFRIVSSTGIVADEAARPTAELLAERLRHATGFSLPVTTRSSADSPRGAILLTTAGADATLGTEGYELRASFDSVAIRASAAAGLFYGGQTLLQLLPPEIFAATPGRRDAWPVPGAHVTDRPRFGWRGLLLDVGRHFFSVDEVKRLLDAMALHKLNTFHWHLVDDQGWRIEIKQYPKLTEVGAWRDSTPPYGNRTSDDGRRYGGFYTQAQIREIVAYAAARHITVVPEIEMPGHASAAIASYPLLGNDDVPGYAPRVATRWGVHPYTFAPKDETFRFLENVLSEVCDLFPSKFIHIGGDEAPKTQWKQSKFAQEVMQREGLKTEEELQSWFIRRIGRFLESKNRRLIGWDEIQEGGLPKTATMMVWRDDKWAKHALALGNDVVMATNSHLYLDHYQVPAAFELARGKEFEAISGLLPMEKVYSFNPAYVAENPAQEKQILGTQAQLWSEYFKDFKKVEYMAFPRLAAFAEVAWSPQADRSYPDFTRRLAVHIQRLDQLGLNHGRDNVGKIGEWTPVAAGAKRATLEWDITAQVTGGGSYRVDFNYASGAQALKLTAVVVLEDGREIARDAHEGVVARNSRDALYSLDVPAGRAGAHYTLQAMPASDSGGASAGVVFWEAPSETPR